MGAQVKSATLGLLRSRGGQTLMAIGGVLMAAAGAMSAPPTNPVPPASLGSEYSKRILATIQTQKGRVAITREDLGEYLIARNGPEKLELLINKRIIDEACKRKGVHVSAAEVEAALGEDLKGMNVNQKEFVEKILRHYNKTLYEWKEDVLKPKIAMSKLVKDRVHVTDKDLQDAFEAHFGEKIECRLILYAKGEENVAMRQHAKLRESEEEFDRAARQQASPSLAATGGRIKPLGHHTTGNEELEKEAFTLQPGEVSRLIGTPDGTVAMKCVRRLPAEANRKFETERAALEKEVYEKKLQLEIPKIFKELRDEAQVERTTTGGTNEDDLLREVRQELSTGPANPGVKGAHGN